MAASSPESRAHETRERRRVVAVEGVGRGHRRAAQVVGLQPRDRRSQAPRLVPVVVGRPEAGIEVGQLDPAIVRR